MYFLHAKNNGIEVFRWRVQNFIMRMHHVFELDGEHIEHILKQRQGQRWVYCTPEPHDYDFTYVIELFK
jgi:hypothetical protein